LSQVFSPYGLLINLPNKKTNKMKLLGLIGFPLSHSFSKKYFEQKFCEMNLLDFSYQNFELKNISEISNLISQLPNLQGLNVTIPYKKEILNYLTDIDSDAKKVGAVNTLKIFEKKIIGFNTDIFGFRKSLTSFLDEKFDSKALILGTGGAAKAVAFVLQELKMKFYFVSRGIKNEKTILYSEIDKQVIENHRLIINSTPVGMFPDVEKFPLLPYEFLTSQHFLFDLIYNPEETKFLELGKKYFCKTKNGLQMLHYQADKSFEIWNS